MYNINIKIKCIENKIKEIYIYKRKILKIIFN